MISNTREVLTNNFLNHEISTNPFSEFQSVVKDKDTALNSLNEKSLFSNVSSAIYKSFYEQSLFFATNNQAITKKFNIGFITTVGGIRYYANAQGPNFDIKVARIAYSLAGLLVRDRLEKEDPKQVEIVRNLK